MDNAIIAILFLFFCFAFAFVKYAKNFATHRLSLFFVSFYGISVIFSAFFYYVNDSIFNVYQYDNLRIDKFVYWIVIFFIMLQPIRKFESLQLKELKYDNKFIHIVCIIGLAIGIIPLLEMLPQFSKTFLGSANLSDSVQEMHDDNEKYIGLSSIGLLLCRIELVLYDLSFVFIFPLFHDNKKNKLAIAGLIMIILVCNMRSILCSGRTVLFNFIIHFIVLATVLLPMFRQYERKKFIKMTTLLLGISISLFLMITIVRSINYSKRNDDYSFSVFVSRYAGEGFLNYNNYAFDAKETLDGALVFNSFQEILGMQPPKISREYFYGTAYHKQRVPQNVFYTYIGVFVLDLGPLLGAVSLLIIAFLGWQIVPKSCTQIPISRLFLFLCYMKIFEFGMIGYCYSGTSGYYIIIYLVLYAIMRLLKT